MSNEMHDLIEQNKRDGLLCACNKVRVPYDTQTLCVGLTVHGYEHCYDLPRDTAICSRVMQFEAGPNQTTFYACAEHRAKLEKGDVLCFFAYVRDQVQDVKPEDEIPCDFCRED